MQRHKCSGGVAPKPIRLRGQSTIEYVLLIAIIGLVVVFAGPPVARAIQNQFSAVTNTVDGGTDGDAFLSAEEKAYQEAMKTVTQKDAKDWTLDEQKAAATDIAKNGTSSVVYAKAKAAMDAGAEWSVKLTNGKTMTYRIIGINHDDLADGSGKAGLTFEAVFDSFGSQRMTATNTNAGGWEASELRGRLNSGDLWALMPTELTGKIKAVRKMTDNQGGGKAGTPTSTTDKVFLLSSTEIWGDEVADGTQYEYFAGKGVTTSKYAGAAEVVKYWTRTLHQYNSKYFLGVVSDGHWQWLAGDTADTYRILLAFCF